MGATESKLKEEFLWSIAANKEGRVNAFLVVSNNKNIIYRNILPS